MHAGPETPLEEPREPSGPSNAGAPPTVAVAIAAVGHAFGALEVIERLDLEVAPGEVVGLVGHSGCGKSTLLELVAGLRTQTRGTIGVGDGDSPGARLAGCAYMPQRDLLLPWLAAIDNAAIAPRNRGASRAEARAQAAQLFERFSLEGFEHARPDELSGGMRQRVAFLRTLLAGKPVLLLDEPFASLDAITRGRMQAWLAEALAAEARTVLLVTHDVEEALYLCDRVLVLGPRPARAVAELSVSGPRTLPRKRVVADPDFVAVRERALGALEEGSR